jgi:hypothetical protein
VRNWIPAATLFGLWARSKLDGAAFGAEQLRDGLPTFRAAQGVSYLPLFAALAAEAEAEAGQADEALALVGEALDESRRTGFLWLEADLRLVGGEIVARLGSASLKRAEDELTFSLDLAREQGARAFEMRAALALAKLRQSTGRLPEAYAILVPALEGFSPTPEFPEIAEARKLLAVLAETEDVKNVVAKRQRRLQLQTSYGRAVMYSRGYGATETKAAFTRAQELTAGIDDTDERLAIYYGHWIGSLVRAEMNLARETAEIFRREAVTRGGVESPRSRARS